MMSSLVIFKWAIHQQKKKIQWGKFSGRDQVSVAQHTNSVSSTVINNEQTILSGCTNLIMGTALPMTKICYFLFISWKYYLNAFIS